MMTVSQQYIYYILTSALGNGTQHDHSTGYAEGDIYLTEDSWLYITQNIAMQFCEKCFTGCWSIQ